MTKLYWFIVPISYAINYIDDLYKTLKRMLHLGTSEDTYLTNKAKDLDLERHHHVDQILRIRGFNSVGMHTIKGAIPILEEECGNLYKIQSKVINAIGGLFAKVLSGKTVEVTDNFDRADGALGTDWSVYGGNLEIESNKVRENSLTVQYGAAVNKNPLTAYPSHYVQAKFTLDTGTNGYSAKLLIRGDSDTDPDNYYRLEYFNAADVLYLRRYVNDTGYVVKQLLSAGIGGGDHVFKLVAMNIGNTVRLLGYVDDVLLISGDDSTADKHLTGEYAGFEIYNHTNSANDVQLDDYESGLGSIPDEYQRALSQISEVEFSDDFNRSDTNCVADAGVGLGSDWIHDTVDEGLLILTNKTSVNGCSDPRGFASYKNQLSSLDQSVNADFTFSDHAHPGYLQLSLRQLATGTMANVNRYFLFYIGDLDVFRIMKRITPNTFILAEVSYSFRNETRNIRFEAIEIGGGVELKGYVDGQLVINAIDFTDVITGKYCGLYLAIGEASSYIDADNFSAGSPGGTLDIIKNGTPAILLSPWIRHLMVYDEDEKVNDPVGGISDLIIYITLNGITDENSDEGTVYLWYNPTSQILYVFSSLTDQTNAYNGDADPEVLAIAKAINIESGVEKYFIQQHNNSRVFGTVYLNTTPSYVLATYITKRHELTEILKDYIPSHTLTFLDGFRKYNVSPYGITKIGNGLTFTNFTVDPAGCIEDMTTYFRLKTGYENQQITITGEDVQLTVTDKNYIFDVVHWMRNKIGNYFRIEVKQAYSQGDLSSADWREFKNNSSLRAEDGTLEAWHKFRIKFMVKDTTDIIIENFIYKQVLEYLNDFFVPG